MNKLKNFIALFLVSALIWLSSAYSTAHAQPQIPLNFNLSGFATIGAARSYGDSDGPVRNISQPHGISNHWSLKTDSLLGLQLNLGIGDNLEAGVQVVSHYRSDGTFRPDLTSAYLRYQPTAMVNVRVGRMGTEFYMRADSRHVGYSYLTVRPPVDFYATLPFNYFDGVDLALTHPIAGGLLQTKLYAGLSKERAPWNVKEDLLKGATILGGYLDFIADPWQIRVGHSRAKIQGALPTSILGGWIAKATAQELAIEGSWLDFTTLGLIYDHGPFKAELMAGRMEPENRTFQKTWSGYFLLSQRLDEFTPFAGLSVVKSAPRPFRHPIPGYTNLIQAGFHNDHHTFTLGTRWDLSRNLCLKAQIDMLRGDASSTFLLREQKNHSWDGSMNIFSISLDMVF